MSKLSSGIFFHLFLFLLLSILSTVKINAQEVPVEDSTVVYDTTVSIDDSSPGTTDMGEKHMYDTSQNFFNWKTDPGDRFMYDTLSPLHAKAGYADSLKKQDEFWYLSEVKTIRDNYERFKTDSAYRDSLLKAGFQQGENDSFKPSELTSLTSQLWFKNLVWLIIIGIFVFAVIYFLLANKVSLFSRKNTKIALDADEDMQDIHAINFRKELDKAINEKNFRYAVRLLYLQTLKMLGDKSLITYNPVSTNHQYLMQLRQSDLYPAFTIVTRHYEYVWYGQFQLQQAAYQLVQEDFVKMQQNIQQH